MRRITLLLAVAIAASLSAVAHAAAPVHEWVSIDDTFTFDDCGFTVSEHDTANLHFVSWFDADGNRQRQLVLAPNSQVTWTNVATGTSVSSVNPYVVYKHDNPDGSSTISFSGLVFALPGGGRAYVDSGRDIIVFSDGGIEPISSVGPSADLCEALAATIG